LLFIRQQSVLAQRKDTFETGRLWMAMPTLGREIRYDSNEIEGMPSLGQFVRRVYIGFQGERARFDIDSRWLGKIENLTQQLQHFYH
jgi:hypothetical protein